MFFTQEDYLKIQQWLQRNSVKDTEFQEAADLIGNEVVTLVQNGSNKKVYLKDLVNQIFSIGVTDFINVSSLYEKYNITLSDAIKLVPYKSRKRGQVITFLNTDGNWEIYQFTGVKNQWNNIEFWKDLFDWQTILDISFEADEEDITSNISNEEEKIKLSFKNREYDPLIHSGLGYKILRKNIVQYTDPTHGELTKNILYQNMVSNTYTIYEIRYDFDLDGQTINIPEGCVLQYRGGSLSNGTLIYEDTIIEGVERLSNVNIEGNYRYPYTGDESNPDTQLAPTMTQFRKLNTQVNNIADDEDLTKIYDDEKGQEVLQLKDRKYVQGSNNGMGYVILRQNKSFKEQLTQSNTIYEIRYDFDLGGEEVEIPENCVLKFEGGSLKNGVIVFDNTELIGDVIVHCDCSGVVKNDTLYVSWFGADNTGEMDNINVFDSISKVVSATKNCTIIFDEGTYMTSVRDKIIRPEHDFLLSPLYFNECNFVHIKMNGALIKLKPNSNNYYNIIRGLKCQSIIIENGTIIGDSEEHDYSQNELYNTHEWCYAINVSSCNAIIKNINASRVPGDAIYCGTQYGVEYAGSIVVENCELHHCGRQGISITSNTGVSIRNTYIHHIGTWDNCPGYAPMSGIDFEYEDQQGHKGFIFIDGLKIENTTRHSIMTARVNDSIVNNDGFMISNCILDNTPQFSNANPTPVVNNTTITCRTSVNNGYLFGSFKNCSINDDATGYLHLTINGTFENCKIKRTTSIEVPIYCNADIINCKISGFTSKLEDSVGIYLSGGRIVNSEIDNSLICLTYPNDKIAVLDNVIFENCKFYRQNTGKITISNSRFINVLMRNVVYPIELINPIIDYNKTEIDDDSNNMFAIGFNRVNVYNGVYNITGLLTKKVMWGAGYVSNSDITANDLTGMNFSDTIFNNCVIKGNNGIINNNVGSLRPTGIYEGYVYFDTTLNKPIWWTGNKWVDATGAEV